MKRTAIKTTFNRWIVWSVWHREGRYFDSREEAMTYADQTGGIPEYIDEVYPA